jgi:NitT/TauT family transport system permease protein
MDGSVARRFLLGLAPWVGAIATWYAVRWSGLVNASLIPAPHQVASKFVELLLHEGLLFDIYASTCPSASCWAGTGPHEPLPIR